MSLYLDVVPVPTRSTVYLGVGLIGYALLFLTSIAGWFNLVDLTPSASGWDVLVLPVAAFEVILLPFWLLFRGFKTPEAPEHPAAE